MHQRLCNNLESEEEEEEEEEERHLFLFHLLLQAHLTALLESQELLGIAQEEEEEEEEMTIDAAMPFALSVKLQDQSLFFSLHPNTSLWLHRISYAPHAPDESSLKSQLLGKMQLQREFLFLVLVPLTHQ